MSEPIQLKINPTRPLPNAPKENAQGDLTQDQVQALISAISNINPQVFVLPEGKTLADIHIFRFLVKNDRSGQLSVIFN